MNRFYVWPDGTIQDTEESGHDPYHWMGDDYRVFDADSEDEARARAELEGLIV